MKSQETRARQLLHAEEADLVYGKWQFRFKLSGSGNFASLNRTAKPATFGRQGERSTLLKGYGRDAADLLQRTAVEAKAAAKAREDHLLLETFRQLAYQRGASIPPVLQRGVKS